MIHASWEGGRMLGFAVPHRSLPLQEVESSQAWMLELMGVSWVPLGFPEAFQGFL
jgi:hypothetical protein